MEFSRVLMTDQPEIAKVNRKTGVLYLSSKVWDQLPTDQKEFVLFHEAGHLKMQTSDEFSANEYAISKFSPAGKFTNKELGKKILVMREILNKADDGYSSFSANSKNQNSNFTGGLLSEAVGSVFQNLSILGVGSKAKINQINAASELEAAQSKNNTKLLLIGGALLIVGIVVFFTLKK